MTNPERDPDVLTCETHVTPGVEIMTPREVPLGGPRRWAYDAPCPSAGAR